MPHHTAGVCGWGHQPFEQFALLNWQQTFKEFDLPTDYKNMQLVMERAFHWWKYLDDTQTSQHTTQLPVREMLRQIAIETGGLPVTHFGRAFQQVNFFDTPSPDDSDIVATYGGGTTGEGPDMLDLMQRTIGETMAFLTKASDYVPAVDLQTDPCSCQTGWSRFGQDSAGDLIPAANGACTQCGMGTFQNLPAYADGECVTVCPANEPTLVQGVCTATGACPPATPFSRNGTCVASCGGGSVVVNNYQCQTGGCPAGTLPDTANPSFCDPVTPSKSPAVCGQVNGDGTTSACCGPDHGLCAVDTDCCSHQCRDDGICLAGTGNTCDSDNDCLSNSCVNGSCGQGHPGSTCAKPSDCLSGLCPNTNVCPPGIVGTNCSLSTDCTSEVCGSNGVCLGTTGDPCGSQNSLCIYGFCHNGACTGGPGDSCNDQSCGVGEQCNFLTLTCCGNNSAVCKTNADCCTGACSNTFTPSIPGTCTGIIGPG